MEHTIDATGAARKGKLFFLCLTAAFIIVELLFANEVLLDGDGDLAGVFFKVLFFLTFFFLTYQGLPWAKWILSLLLALFGLALLAVGYEQENTLLKLSAITQLYTAVILHFSSNLKAFYQLKRSTEATTFTQMEVDQAPAGEGLSAAQQLGSEKTGSGYSGAVDEALDPYPTLLRRVQASMIDVIVLFIALLVLFQLIDLAGEVPVFMRITALILLFAYEPLMTAQSATLGQRVMGIQVKDYVSKSNISFLKAFIRYLLKLSLGWLSYLAIHTNREKRAIHDMGAGTIMQLKK